MNKDTITRYWLAAAIVATVVVAVLAPGPAKILPEIYFIDIGVVVIMFFGSLKLAPDRFLSAATRPGLVALSVVCTFALAPLVSLGLAWPLGLTEGPYRISVLICSAQASTLATAIVLTEIAGADVALAMVITVINNLVTVVMTPLVFKVLGGTDVEVDHTAMATEMALKIVVPVIAAQITRKWLENWAKRHSRKLSVLTQLIIVVYIYAGVAAAVERLGESSNALIRVIVLVLLFHPILLMANALLSRMVSKDPGSRAAFVLCSSQKTLPAAILIWKSHFATLSLGPLVAVSYHLIQLIVDSILAPSFTRLPIIRNQKG